MAPTTYNYISFAQAKQQIANRLYDPTKQFWADAELGDYLQESLRTWNALTSYWRGDFQFNLTAFAGWYSIPSLANTLRPITLEDTDLYRLILYHLLEPTATGVDPYAGSSQFSADDIVDAVTRCQDELLGLTGCTISRITVGAVAGRIQLPDTVIDVRRMAYLPTVVGSGYGLGKYGCGPYGGMVLYRGSTMWPADAWGESSFDPDYTITPAGTPQEYLMSTQPPIAFDTDKPPAFAGQYELLTVNAGAQFAAGSPNPLSIPDDWAHVIKWGALADLFSRESNARDPLRAQYCSQRYMLGVKLLSSASAILAARINNVPLQIDSARDADLYDTSWQAQPAARPNKLITTGLNLIGFTPITDSNYGIALTVVENAPVPSLDADPVQVSRDDLDAILDYAQHLAAVKMSGAEFTATMPLFQNFLAQAKQYGLKLDEIAEFTSVIFNQSQREADMNPRLAPTPEAA